MSKMKPEIREQWTAALRSGEYEQTTENLKKDLGDGKVGYCCLGVLTDLAIKAGVPVVTKEVESTRHTCSEDVEAGECKDVPATAYYFDGGSSYTPSSVMEWAGLHVSNPAVPYKVHPDFPNDDHMSLAALNDGEHLDFNQIADLIDQHV